MIDTTQTMTDALNLDRLARRAPATDDLRELAAWLQANSHTHLSPIERIELAERMITRRRFLIGMGALVLAGCGAPSASAPTATVATTRTYNGPAGPVEFPANLQRVIPGYLTDSDVAVVLELPLVGAPGAGGGANQEFASYHADALKDLPKVAMYPEINLEQITALDPDVILDSVPYKALPERYDQLSQVAPVINVGESFAQGWRTYLRAAAGAFGRETLAENFITAYDARVDDIRQRVAERYGEARFIVVETYSPGTFWITHLETQSGSLLKDDLGLTPAQAVPATRENEGHVELSVERLDLLADADIIFVAVDPATSGAGQNRTNVDALLSSPLWQQLPAVQKGQIYEYGSELYYGSPLVATAFLDLAERALLA